MAKLTYKCGHVASCLAKVVHHGRISACSQQQLHHFTASYSQESKMLPLGTLDPTREEQPPARALCNGIFYSNSGHNAYPEKPGHLSKQDTYLIRTPL